MIIGGFDVVDVEFLTYHANVTIVDPSQIVPDPSRYARIFATNKTDLERVLGKAAAAGAQPVALDPWGKPAVWAVTP